MNRMILILALLWAPFAAAYEATLKIPGSPEIRAALGPRDVVESHGYVDGQFVLRIQIVSAHAFEALNFQMPDIPNARVVTVLKPRTKAVSTYAGSGFIFETALAIFPETSGELIIPPIIADGQIQPEGQDRTPFHTETLTQRVAIWPAPADQAMDWWIVTPRVEVAEDWSAPPYQAHPGDIIRRDVTMTVYGVEAERLPEVVLGPSDGVTASDRGGERKTLLSTDGVISKVTRSWDIRIDDAYTASIGPVEMKYWHPVNRRIQTATAPAHQLEPTPADPAAAAARLMAKAGADRQVGLAAAAALGLLIAAPCAAILAIALFALLPHGPDRRLRAALRSAPDDQARFRAIDDWMLDAGVDLTDGPESYRTLNATLFASRAAGGGTDRLASDLLRISRNGRILRLKSKVRNWLSAVVGPNRHLEG